MYATRFDTLTRSLTDTHSRRGALIALAGGTLGLLERADTAAKKGNGKKKRRKKNGKRPTTPPSCAEMCESNCFVCAYRPGGSTLCIDGYELSDSCAVAQVCSSDDDCRGNPAAPYCIRSGEERASGNRYPPLCYDPDGKGRCVSIAAC